MPAFGQRFKAGPGSTYDPTTGGYTDTAPVVSTADLLNMFGGHGGPRQFYVDPKNQMVDDRISAALADRAVGVAAGSDDPLAMFDDSALQEILQRRAALRSDQTRLFADPTGAFHWLERGGEGWGNPIDASWQRVVGDGSYSPFGPEVEKMPTPTGGHYGGPPGVGGEMAAQGKGFAKAFASAGGPMGALSSFAPVSPQPFHMGGTARVRRTQGWGR